VSGISELARESARLISDLFQFTQDNAQASSLVRVPFRIVLLRAGTKKSAAASRHLITFILLFANLSTVTNLQTQKKNGKIYRSS